MQIKGIRVFVGDTNLCLNEWIQYKRPSQSYRVQQIIFHYNYDDDLLINDIAVVKLTNTIWFRDYIKPIRLPPTHPKEEALSYTGKPAKFSGWGLTNLSHSQSKPMILQHTEDITVQNKSICDRFIHNYFHSENPVGKYSGIYASVLCTNATHGSAKAANFGPVSLF